MAKHPKTVREPTGWRQSDREGALRLEPVPAASTAFATRTAAAPSRRLMLAVLADAVATFRRTAPLARPRDARLFAETAHWFASDDTTEPFAFRSVCDALGLDAGYLRQGLRSVRGRARRARHALH